MPSGSVPCFLSRAGQLGQAGGEPGAPVVLLCNVFARSECSELNDHAFGRIQQDFFFFTVEISVDDNETESAIKASPSCSLKKN